MMRKMTKLIDKGLTDLRTTTLAPANFTVSPDLITQNENVDTIKDNMKEIVKEMKKQAKATEMDLTRNMALSDIFDAFSKACQEKNSHPQLAACLRDSAAFVQRLNDLISKMEENVQQVLCTTMETFVTDGLKPALEQKRQYDREAMDYDNLITKHKSLKKSGKATPQKEKESEQQLADTREEYLATEKTTLDLMKQAALKGEMLTIVKLVEYWDCMSVYFKEGAKFLETMQPKVERYRKHIRELSKVPVSASSSASPSGSGGAAGANSGAGTVNTKVFKVPLQKLCERENRRVPMLIVACCKFVAENGLDTQGIFRVSPTKDHLDELKVAIDQGRNYDFSDVSSIHVISGLLKAFFREMPEPIFTFERYAKLMEASKLPTVEAQVATIAKIMKSLPEVNYKSIQHVSKLCILVDSRKAENRMTISNLATVLTPNMLYTTVVDPITMVQEMEQANKIYSLIVEHYAEMFPEDDLEKDEPPAPTLKQSAESVSLDSSTSSLKSSLSESNPLSASLPTTPTPGEEDTTDGSAPAKKRRIKMTTSLKLDTPSISESSDVDGDGKKRTPRSSRSKRSLKGREDSINSSHSSPPNTPGATPSSPEGGNEDASNDGSMSPSDPAKQHQRGAASVATMEDLKRALSHRLIASESSTPTSEGENPKSPGGSELKRPIKPPKKISVSNSAESIPSSPAPNSDDKTVPIVAPTPVDLPRVPPRPNRMSLPPSTPPPKLPPALPPTADSPTVLRTVVVPVPEVPAESATEENPQPSEGTVVAASETLPVIEVSSASTTGADATEEKKDGSEKTGEIEAVRDEEKQVEVVKIETVAPTDDDPTVNSAQDQASKSSETHHLTEKPIESAIEENSGTSEAHESTPIVTVTAAEPPSSPDKEPFDEDHDYLDELALLSARPKMEEEDVDDDEIPLDLPDPSPEVAALLDPSIHALADALVQFARASTSSSLNEEDGVHKLSQMTREVATQARSLAAATSVLVGNFPESEQSIVHHIEELQTHLRTLVLAVKEVSADVSQESAIESLRQAIGLYASHITALSDALSQGSLQQLSLAALGSVKRATAIVAPTIRAIISSTLEDSVSSVKASMQKELDQLVALTTLLSAQLIKNVLDDPMEGPLQALPGLFDIFWKTATVAVNSADPQESAQTLVQHAKSLISALRDVETAVTSVSAPDSFVPQPTSEAAVRAALTRALEDFSTRVEYGSTSSLTTRLLLASAKRTIKRFTQAGRSFQAPNLDATQEYIDLGSKLLAFIKYHRFDAPESSAPVLSATSSAMLDLVRLRSAVIEAWSAEGRGEEAPLPLSYVLRLTQHLNKAIFA